MTENKKVPKFRFPDFNDEWDKHELNILSDKIGDGLHATPEYINDSEYYFINGNNLINKKIIITDTTKSVSFNEYEKYKKDLSKNTILISINGTIGNLAFYNNEKVMLGKSIAYINLKSSINKEFIYNYLQTNQVKHYFQSELTGTTIKNLSLKTLNNTNIKLPSKEEQDKIGGFLSCVDKKIDLLNQQLIKTQDFKKGLMQQIFTQKIRFKNFNKEWKIIKLKDLLECSSSKLSLNDLEDNEGEYSLYGATGIIKSIDFCEKTEPYLAIVKDGAGVGRSFLCEPNTSIVGTLQYLEPKENIILEFSYYILNTIEFRKYIVGSTIPHIYFKDYSKEKVLIPEIEEQRKITGILSTTDKKINLIQNQISHMEQFKKGLLQQMFI